MHFSKWQNKLGLFWLSLLSITAFCLALAWFKNSIHIETDIFKLLPTGEYSEQVHDANQRVNQLINRKLFLVLEAKDEQALAQATTVVLHQTVQSPLWQATKPLLDTDALGKVLFQHRVGLLSEQDQKILQAGDYQALSEQALSQLISPGLPISADLLKNDPLLFFPRYIVARASAFGPKASSDDPAIQLPQSQLSERQLSEVQLIDGWPTTQRDGYHYRLLILSLAQSPFNIDYQSQTQAWLHDLNSQLKKSYQVNSYSTGTLMFATAGTQSARQEVSTIGLGSTLGLIVLVWFGFRSFRPLLTELAAVSAGCLMALAVTHLIFQQVHLMTLVFGASLIGVSVDFSFYYLSAQAALRNENSGVLMGRMLPSLVMGLLTTVAAYLCLSLTPFPGLKQIAVFSMSGLMAAWLTSILLLPKLPPLDNSRILSALGWLVRVRQWFLAHLKYRIGLVLAVLVISAIGFSQIRTDDQVQSLQTKNTVIAAQDGKIKKLFHQQQSSQYFVVYGDNEKQMAGREQQLLGQLQQLVAAGKLENYQALGDWLPTVEVQQQNKQWQQQIPLKILQEYAAATGISLEDMQRWQGDLANKTFLDIGDLKETPLNDLQLKPQQRIVLLGTLTDMAALKQIKLSGVEFVDPVNDLSSLFAQYRVQAQYMIMLALLLLSLILAIVYDYKSLLNLLLPVSLALLSTFAVQGLLGVPLNLFGVMAAFLILGIGVDYAIFYQQDVKAEKRVYPALNQDVNEDKNQHSSITGIGDVGADNGYVASGNAYVTSAMFLCMLATILGFGLLALSRTQAIHTFGLTVLLGVIFSFVFATLLTKSHEVLSVAQGQE